MSSFDAYEEEKDYSTWDERSEGHEGVGDGTTAIYADDESHSRTSINTHLDNEVIDALALLEEYEEDFNSDYEGSVDREMSGSNLDSLVFILNQFTLRCAFDHLRCIATKEKEKDKQAQRQQACLQLVSIARRVIVRRVFLVFNRIAWHESVVAAMRQRKQKNAVLMWKDATAASRKRRQVLFLMMVFNRWRVLTEESISMRQKNYASLMHWAERLTRRSFTALKSHAISQREERLHALDRFQSQTTLRSSFRSPEQSLAWRNSTDYTNRSSLISSSRYGGSGSFTGTHSHRTSFQSITLSTRFDRNRFQELGSAQKASYSSYRFNFSSDVLQNSRRTALTQPYGSSHPRSANDFSVPFGCAVDDDDIV